MTYSREITRTVRTATSTATLVISHGQVSSIRTGSMTFTPEQARFLRVLSGEETVWLGWADAIDAAFAADPDVDPDALVALVCTKQATRIGQARTITSRGLLAALAHDRSKAVRNALTRHLLDHTDHLDLLDVLATDADSEVRRKIAQHPRTPQHLHSGLTSAPEHLVRLALARNPNIARHIQDRLMADSNASVRSGLVHNPTLTLRNMTSLAADPATFIRESVATHPALPRHLQVALLEDPISAVRRTTLANMSHIPAEHQTALTTDRALTVRRALAMHPDLTCEALIKLTGDLSVQVRAVIAVRPHAPTVALRTLAADQNYAVRDALLSRPDLTEELCDLYAINATSRQQALLEAYRQRQRDPHLDAVRWCQAWQQRIDARHKATREQARAR